MNLQRKILVKRYQDSKEQNKLLFKENSKLEKQIKKLEKQIKKLEKENIELLCLLNTKIEVLNER